jgi:hypothetical protein
MEEEVMTAKQHLDSWNDVTGFVTKGTSYYYELISVIEDAMKDCPHPGCCCVCGHAGKCPEDGPSAIDFGPGG